MNAEQNNSRPNVRRQLFPTEPNESTTENYMNRLQEELKTQTKEMSSKWGFDFENDTPLDGDYDWTVHTSGPYEWVGVPKPKPDTTEDLIAGNNNYLPMRKRNEQSPINTLGAVEQPPVVRKRSTDTMKIEESGAKKKLKF